MHSFTKNLILGVSFQITESFGRAELIGISIMVSASCEINTNLTTWAFDSPRSQLISSHTRACSSTKFKGEVTLTVDRVGSRKPFIGPNLNLLTISHPPSCLIFTCWIAFKWVIYSWITNQFDIYRNYFLKKCISKLFSKQYKNKIIELIDDTS